MKEKLKLYFKTHENVFYKIYGYLIIIDPVSRYCGKFVFTKKIVGEKSNYELVKII